MSNDPLEKLYPALWRFAAATCGNAHDPDDVLQEAIVKALRRHDLSELDHPAAYLRKAIVSVVIDQARRRRRSPLISGLSVDVEGNDFAEAAAMVGCPPSVARKRASRARRSLRTALESEESE